MTWNGMRKGGTRLALAWMVALVAACGAGDDPVKPDPEVSPLVGDWSATTMVISSVANPDLKVDILEQGATFDLNVQPSGQYTAILIYAGQASTEIGILSVSGNVVTMSRSFPNAETTTALYSLSGNQLTLDGDTEFDFNLDGTADAATAHIVLTR
jgi:hypothetical protein